MIAIHATHTILDRWQGTAQTYEIWGENPSTRFLTPAIADVDRRRKLTEFFLSRKLNSVIKTLVQVRTFKPSEVMFTKSELYNAILAHSDDDVASQIADLVIPGFLSLGTVVGRTKYSRHVRYGYSEVDVSDIQRDVSAYQVIQAVKSVKLGAVSRDTKYSVGAFAEIVSEEYRRVGLALLELDNLASIVSDIVTGVRAYLDPLNSSGGVVGVAPKEWMSSPIVEEAAKNVVFVDAALNLPIGSNVVPVNNGWKLDQWGKLILAALQSSERYAWVPANEVLRNFSLRKVRDNEGLVVSTVLSKRTAVQAISQTVFALEDDMMQGAYALSATNDHAGAFIQVGYGTSDFNVDEAGGLYTSVATHLAESGYSDFPAVTFNDLLTDSADSTRKFIAMALSERVYATPSGDGDNVFKMTYIVRTNERPATFLRFLGTEHRGDEIATNHVEAVLFASEAFTAVEAVPVQPQVYGPAAFDSKLVGFDESTVLRGANRFSFNTVINGLKIEGVIKPNALMSMRTMGLTSVVRPHFNATVIEAYTSTLERVWSMIDKAQKSTSSSWQGPKPSPALFTLLKKQVGHMLLECARKISPSFRGELNRAIVDRAIANYHKDGQLSYDEERVLGARMTQQAYVAFCDLIALEFFLFVQGIDNKDLSGIIADPEVIHSYLDASFERG